MKRTRGTYQELTIEEEQLFFVWLLRELDAASPRIAVTPSLASTKNDLLLCILSGIGFDYPPITWDEIMSSIRWADMQGSDEPRCGLKLLIVMGHFFDFLNEQCGGEIPIINAIEMMVRELDPLGEFFRFRRKGKQWRIESTPKCTERYEVKVKVRCPTKLYLGEPLPTDDESEDPN